MSQNDGGPAFPTKPVITAAGEVWRDGMTLRDYFAAAYRFDLGEPSLTQAKAVMGDEPPAWVPGNFLCCMRWWMTAEARLRYLYADIMLAERQKKPDAPKMCIECGLYPADPPSNLCPGCEAYKEHCK